MLYFGYFDMKILDSAFNVLLKDIKYYKLFNEFHIYDLKKSIIVIQY